MTEPTYTDTAQWGEPVCGEANPTLGLTCDRRPHAPGTAHAWPINFPLLTELAEKPHPLLNIADDLHQVPVAWLSEVMHEARTAHHLLDMVSIPAERGYKSDLDARTYLVVRKILELGERLDRIRSWHARETGPSGTVGDYCTECGTRWPCATRRMADGTYVDEPAEAQP